MKLKKMRLKYGLTQEKMAEKLNIKRATYANYENSNTEPTLELLIKIADFLHISIDELIGRKQENFIDKGLLSETELSIINIMNKLNPAKIEKLESYAIALLQTQDDEQVIINKFKRNK